MRFKDLIRFSKWIIAAGVFFWFFSVISSCGKSNITSATNLNIKYNVINLSPDLYPVNLYIDFIKTNNTSFSFPVNQGYFTLGSIDTPFQFKSASISGGPVLLARKDILKRDNLYTLFIVGDATTKSVTSIFTVDTSGTPGVSRCKIRFVNASPTATNGLDLYANGTKIFSNIQYTKFSNFFEIPNGNYNLAITNTGSSDIINTFNTQTVQGGSLQDGRLYTLYAYGYTNRTDSAAFNSAIIVNR